MIRTYLTVCAVLACAIGAVSSGAVLKDAPGCTVADAEKCGYEFVPFFGTPLLVETAKDLQDHCKLFKGQLQCVQNFGNKCWQGQAKGFVSLMIGAAIDEYGSICDPTTPKHKEYLDNIKCINKAGPEVQTCFKDFFVALHRATTAPVDKQIGYTCCYYHDFVDCAEKRLTSKCNLPAANQFFNVVIEKVVGEGLSQACNAYKKGSGACAALPALSKNNDSKVRDKGFIEPLVTITGNVG